MAPSPVTWKEKCHFELALLRFPDTLKQSLIGKLGASSIPITSFSTVICQKSVYREFRELRLALLACLNTTIQMHDIYNCRLLLIARD